jgi:hypothetical protein
VELAVSAVHPVRQLFLYKFGLTLEGATNPIVNEAYAKMFLDKIEELHLGHIIASESFLAYHQIELGLLLIGECEGTKWLST